jgi:hypothetical protein
MKSFQFTSLACLMLSASQVMAIDEQLEHHHVSIQIQH